MILIWTLLVVVFMVGFVFWLASREQENCRLRDTHDHTVFFQADHQLKMRGIPVEVQFTLCEIKSNNYIEEVTTGGYRTQFYDGLHNDNEVNTHRIPVYQSVVIYVQTIKDLDCKFVSPILPFDRTTLMFKLDKQKKTTLYIDESDPTNYFFDFTFLNESV